MVDREGRNCCSEEWGAQLKFGVYEDGEDVL